MTNTTLAYRIDTTAVAPPRRGVLGRYAPAILALQVWCLPFNGVPGPGFLRELSTEAAVYPMLAFVAIAGPTLLRQAARGTYLILAVALVIIVSANLLFNFDAISRVRLGDTTGIAKFASSLGVFLFYLTYCLCLGAYLRTRTAAQVVAFTNRVVLPLSVFLVLVWSLEFASWYFEPLRAVMEPLKRSVSVGDYYQRFRLSGVSFEPSFNAIIMIGFLPALILGGTSSLNRKGRRTSYWLLTGLFVLFGAFSDSRTGYFILWTETALVTVLFMVKGVGPLRIITRWLIPAGAIVLAPVLLYAVASDTALSTDYRERSSDIARLTSINVAINTFLEHPVLGVGFGQYGFYYRALLNPSGYRNPEVVSYVSGSRMEDFAPSYSLYWRVAAETGIIGFLAFYGVVASFFGRLSRPLSKGRSSTTFTLLIASGLAASILVGISFDSYRAPFLWMYLALASSTKYIVAGVAPGTLRHSPW